MRNLRYYLMAVLLTAFKVLSGQSLPKEIKPSDIVIEGKLVDSLLSLYPDSAVQVSLIVSSFPANMTVAPITEYKTLCKYGEKFQFVIPGSERIFVNVQFSTLDHFKYWSGFDNIYIFEPGDRIYCELANDIFSFSGKGAERLQCQTALYKVRYNFTKADNELENTGQWKKAIDFHSLKMDSILQVRISKVKEFAPKIEKEMTNIMLANCYGMRYFDWLRTAQLTRANYTRFQAFINSKAYAMIDKNKGFMLEPNILVQSPYFCDYLIRKISFDNATYKDGKLQSTKSAEHIERMFNFINKNYQGIMRDKLLMELIFINKQSPVLMEYIHRISEIIKFPKYLTALDEFSSIYYNGLPFYPFEFEDVKGNKVKLSDFKNDVIILDFWYSGCENCIILNHAMQPVIDNFRKNRRVKFVSISIDKSKDGWLKSVSSGLYSHKESISLYTGGVGRDHPLFKKYRIFTYPTLYIIKAGKMFSSTPPRPLYDRTTQTPVVEGNTEQFIKLIERALK